MSDGFKELDSDQNTLGCPDYSGSCFRLELPLLYI